MFVNFASQDLAQTFRGAGETVGFKTGTSACQAETHAP